MIAATGFSGSRPAQPAFRPIRDAAQETLYSPPPTHASNSGVNSIRWWPLGERRIMHSPSVSTSSPPSLRAGIFTATPPP